MTRTDARDRTFGPQGLRRRAELMEATVALSAEKGFSQTRVSDIVGRVGVGQGVFYWYFTSKDALFREILTDTTRRLRMFQAAYVAEDPDPVRRIARGIVATMEFIAHNLHAFAFLDHAQARARHRQDRLEADRVHVLDTARHLAEGMDEGAIRPSDTEALSHAITGVVDRLARAAFSRPDPDVSAVAQQAVDFCLAGICGTPEFSVSELRADVELTPELVEIRDRVGAGGVNPRDA